MAVDLCSLITERQPIISTNHHLHATSIKHRSHIPFSPVVVLNRTRLGPYRTQSPTRVKLHCPSQQFVVLAIRKLTIFLVASPHVNVKITLPGMVATVQAGDLGQERARITGQRMKTHSIYAKSEGLLKLVSANWVKLVKLWLIPFAVLSLYVQMRWLSQPQRPKSMAGSHTGAHQVLL